MGGLTGDFLAIDLRAALQSLGTITGRKHFLFDYQ